MPLWRTMVIISSWELKIVRLVKKWKELYAITDAKQLLLNITVNVSGVNGFITTMSDPTRLDAIVLATHPSVNNKTQFESASKTAKNVINTLNTSGSQRG